MASRLFHGLPLGPWPPACFSSVPLLLDLLNHASFIGDLLFQVVGEVAALTVQGRGDNEPLTRLSQVLEKQFIEAEEEKRRMAEGPRAGGRKGNGPGRQGGQQQSGAPGARRGRAFQGCGWAMVLDQGAKEEEATRKMGAAAVREMFLTLPTFKGQFAADSVHPANRTAKQARRCLSWLALGREVLRGGTLGLQCLIGISCLHFSQNVKSSCLPTEQEHLAEAGEAGPQAAAGYNPQSRT